MGGKERRKGEGRRGKVGGEFGREGGVKVGGKMFVSHSGLDCSTHCYSVWEELFQILVRIRPREESSDTLSSCSKSL